jgi:predicted dehydrogenase
VKFGLLGCGTIAFWSHLPAMRHLRGATLVAAADPDPAARARAARRTRCRIVSDADQVLARPDVDAVVIAAPTPLHAELALAAVRAKKHFYLEKPIATTEADARAVVDAAASAGVIGAIGFNRRHHPLIQHARELVRAGVIGRVRAAHTAFCEPTSMALMPAWKRRRETGGGVLLALASHHVDLVRWLLEDEIAEAAAALQSVVTEHDSARLQLTTRRGVEVQGWFSFRTGLADYLELHGERGTLRIDRHAPRLALTLPRRTGYGVRRIRVPPTGAVLAWWARRWLRPSVDPSYRRSLQAFVDRLRGGPAVASLDDGARSLDAILRAESAAASCASS